MPLINVDPETFPIGRIEFGKFSLDDPPNTHDQLLRNTELNSSYFEIQGCFTPELNIVVGKVLIFFRDLKQAAVRHSRMES